MSVIIKCQYTGIEFEADSKRQKNHPVVSAILAKANKDGNYRVAKEALTEGVENGFMTIEQFENLVAKRTGQAQARSEEQARQARVEAQQRKEGRKRRERDRAELNEMLRSHGYRWSKVETSSEYGEAYGAGWGEADGWEWVLYNPDGREVTVAQAKAEIAAR